jgi:hypothetical protein
VKDQVGLVAPIAFVVFDPEHFLGEEAVEAAFRGDARAVQ